MSLLGTITRVCPSLHRNVLARTVEPLGAYETRRGAKKAPRAAKTAEQKKADAFKKKNKGKQIVERDATGKVIVKQRERHPGAFRPLPESQLRHSLFHSNNRPVLKLPTFNSEVAKKDIIGNATEFSFEYGGPARMFGLPKKMLLEFRILSKPCSVIRGVTVETLELLKKAGNTNSVDSRVILSGRPGSGKSYLLLQAVEYCAANDWIVVYIPRAVNLINSSTPYTYDLRTQTYLQPVFANQTLQRILAVNSEALGNLRTQNPLTLEKHDISVGTPLKELVETALKEKSPAISPAILDALMTELEIQGKYPVLLAVDDFQSLYCKSQYRDPFFNTIRPHHLSMPRLLLDYASGRRSFARGALLGALTSSDPIYPVPLELKDTLGLEYDHPVSPYDKRSATVLEYAKGLRSLPVPEKMTVKEAAALFEVWKDDKALTSTSFDELFLSKYTESGGNPRDFVWKGLLSTLES